MLEIIKYYRWKENLSSDERIFTKNLFGCRLSHIGSALAHRVINIVVSSVAREVARRDRSATEMKKMLKKNELTSAGSFLATTFRN